MRLLYMHPVIDNRGRHQCVATVDIELNEHVRLYGLRILRMEDGRYMLRAPQSGKRLAATFSPELAEQIVDTALDKLGVVANAA